MWLHTHTMQTHTLTGYAVTLHSLSNRDGHVGQVLGSHEFNELFFLVSSPTAPPLLLFSWLVTYYFSHLHTEGWSSSQDALRLAIVSGEKSTCSSSGSGPVSLLLGFTVVEDWQGALGISRCTDRSAWMGTKPIGSLELLLGHPHWQFEQLCFRGDLARLTVSFSHIYLLLLLLYFHLSCLTVCAGESVTDVCDIMIEWHTKNKIRLKAEITKPEKLCSFCHRHDSKFIFYQTHYCFLHYGYYFPSN